MDMPEDNKATQTIIAKEGSTVKNMIQAIIHLPAWAWILGVIILSIALLLASAVFNIEPLQRLLPSPPVFAAAPDGQSLIIVADFEDRSGGKYEGIDPAQYVYEQLVAQAQKDNLDVRIERLHQGVDDNSVKLVRETYNATMVVWGWFDALTITPRIDKIGILEGITSDQEGVRLSLADPKKVEFSVVTDLPAQTIYLVMFTLGIDKYASEEFDSALIYLNNAIASVSSKNTTSTNPSESYFYRAYIYITKEDYDHAIDDYSRAIELSPQFAEAYFNRGYVYDFYKENYDRAIADYTKVIELVPQYSEAYYYRGVIYDVYKADYDRAITDYTIAIELNPEDAFAYYARGQIYLYLIEDYNSAIADFNKVIELNSEKAGAYYQRGYAYQEIGDLDRAIANYTKAIEHDPWDVYAYINRGYIYSEIGDYNRAISDYTKASEIDPEDATVYINRGYVYLDTGDYDLAIADFTKEIELNPRDAEAYNNRCWATFLFGKYEEALTDCEKALDLAPDLDYVLDTRASVYAALGRVEDAIKDFEHILEISTDPELRQRAEEELQKLKGQ